MANGRGNPKRKGKDSGRDPGGFVALPWSVLDCAAYHALSHPAKALLMEFARQFVRNNNGALTAERKRLAERGWRSVDVIVRAKQELIDAGFIFETVKGQRPNKASWYALTWQPLDGLPGFDEGAAAAFRRSAYMHSEQPRALVNREAVCPSPGQESKQSVCPSPGQVKAPIGPSPGQGEALPCPSPGPMRATFDPSPCPSPGHHLDMPSEASNSNASSGLLTELVERIARQKTASGPSSLDLPQGGVA